jgi:galactokinase
MISGASIPNSPWNDSTTQEHALQVAAPARINLIGEHTDYTGGLVLPMAIPFYTWASIAPSTDGRNHFRSELFKTVHEELPGAQTSRQGAWSDHPIGVLRELTALGMNILPFSLAFHGNVPFAAGLSSSASLQVAACMALLAYTKSALSEREIALLCQRAENHYVGSPCGIMDQFAVTAARAGHVLLIHTRDLQNEPLPVNVGAMQGTSLVAINSGVKHSTADGAYGERRRQLEAGQAVLRKAFPGLRDLGDATLEQVQSVAQDIEPVSLRRCRHVVTENQRVQEACEALLAGDAQELGRLMTAAHISQRDDFECSCRETDFLVDTANSIEGCYGARMTGGGFGGCTISLVERAKSEYFIDQIKTAYQQQFGIVAEAYLCDAVDGAKALYEAQGRQEP